MSSGILYYKRAIMTLSNQGRASLITKILIHSPNAWLDEIEVKSHFETV
jgi:hypothetical protein